MTQVTDNVHFCGKLISRLDESGKRHRTKCTDRATSVVLPTSESTCEQPFLHDLTEFDFRCWRHVGKLQNGEDGVIVDEYIDLSPV